MSSSYNVLYYTVFTVNPEEPIIFYLSNIVEKAKIEKVDNKTVIMSTKIN
jgi:hypothetical protein